MDRVCVKLGEGVGITGSAENLVVAIADFERSIEELEGVLGYEPQEGVALPTTPVAESEIENELNRFVVRLVLLKLRVRRICGTLDRVFVRLGLSTLEEVSNANQK